MLRIEVIQDNSRPVGTMNPQADVVKKSCLKLKVTRSKNGSPSAVQGVSASSRAVCHWVLRTVSLLEPRTCRSPLCGHLDILVCRKNTAFGGGCAGDREVEAEIL